MTSRPCSLLAALVLVAALLPAGAARAAPQDEAPPAPVDGGSSPIATELFSEGRMLLEQGRYAEACPKLAESAKLEARVGTLGNVADCEERLGHVARARGYWQQAVNLAKAQGDARAAHAEQQLARLDVLVPRLKIAMPSAVPTGLVVRVDAVEVGSATLGTLMPLDPGVHAVEASAPGRTAWRAEVRLPASGGNVEVAIPDLPVVAANVAPMAASQREASVLVETGPSPLGVVGLAATGVGLVGLGVGTYFAGLAQSRTDLSNGLGCVDDRCPPAAASMRESARDAGTMATALLVAGGALAVGGFVTYLLAPSHVERTPVATAARTRPRLGAIVWPDSTGSSTSGAATLSGAF